MTARKPNNLPWIILGGVCCLGFLGLFGLGVYSGAKAVSDEMTVTMPEFPDSTVQPRMEKVLRIVVSEETEISFEGKIFKDVDALENEVKFRYNDELSSIMFILEISEEASHNSLISMKDMLDGLGVRSIIQVQRTNPQ